MKTREKPVSRCEKQIWSVNTATEASLNRTCLKFRSRSFTKHIQHASPCLFQILLFQDKTYLVVFFNNEKVVQGLVH